MARNVFVLALILFVSACAANPSPVEISPGVYMLYKTDRSGIFGNQSTFKAKTFSEAAEFAKSKGKIAIPVTYNTTSTAPGQFATVEYQFLLVDPDSPEAKGRTTLKKAPDINIEINKTIKSQ